MPKKVTLVEFSELLFFAESMGFEWNDAHEFLVNDEIPPMYEIRSRNYYLSDFVPESSNYEFSEETMKIMKGFFEKNNIEAFTLVND